MVFSAFNGDDAILVIYKTGEYELTSYELTNRYVVKDIAVLCRNAKDTVVSAIHLDGENGLHYIKRFQVETTTMGKKFVFISEAEGSKLIVASTNKDPRIKLSHKDGKKSKQESELSLVSLIEVKGWKANGNKLTADKVLKVTLLDSPEEPDRKPSKKEIKRELDEEKSDTIDGYSITESSEGDNSKGKDDSKSGFDVGSTIGLSPKKPKKKDEDPDDDADQLNLF